MKNKLLCFGIIIMFLITNFVAFPSMGIKTEISENNLSYNIIGNERCMYFPSIVIEGDDDFTSENGVINPNARGTKDDQYIISGQEFQYISIVNTRKYFTISNCIINVKGIGISFINVNNGIIKDCTFKNMENGIDILFADSNDNTIEHCSISYEEKGNYFFFLGIRSDNNEIHHCEIKADANGIKFSGFILSECNGNEIHNCKTSGGEYGFALEKSNNNIIHHNNVFDNDINVKILSGRNQWDDGINNGNYWDDYKGIDLNGDGIGDGSYTINSDNIDRYPYMKPIGKSKEKQVNLKAHSLEYIPVLTWLLEFLKSRYPVINCLFSVSLLSSIGSDLPYEDEQESKDTNSVTYTTSPLHDGWLEIRDGVKILHLKGSHYDMGFQHGDLLKDEIQRNLRTQMAYFDTTRWTHEKIMEKYDYMKEFLPQEYQYEIQGMADGSGLPFEDIAVLNTIPAIFNHAAAGSCCEVSLWGPRTVGGELYHIRGWDWRIDLQDPVTGTYFQENQILICRDPDNAYASLYPEFAGHIFSWGGFNEKGIAIGETTCLTEDTTFDGISAAFRMRMVLDYALSGDEAIDIISNNRTCGWNFVISDGNKPDGTAIEQTANILYVGKWNDPIEGTKPFWRSEGLVRRVPYFINPETAATDPGREGHDPSGLLGFIRYLLGIDRSFGVWYFYKTISDAVEDRSGTLDLEGTTALIRDVYAGRTDLLFMIIMKIGLVRSIHQWIACPETGGISVAFSTADKYAFENPVHYFNLFDLLESEPP